MSNPVEQFVIRPVASSALRADGSVPFYAFTNASAVMTATVVVAVLFFLITTRKRSIRPGRWQAAGEMVWQFIATMILDNVGKQGMRYFPFVLTLFLFLLIGNLLGAFPYTFAFTSHIAVSAALAMMIFVGVTVIGFARNGLGYLRIFWPRGAPLAVAPLLIPIELISYLSRPFSLSVRLFANMTVGHIMLEVLAGFVAVLGVAGVIPFVAVVGVTALELFVAALQAYVFTILTCIYLNDAINMH